MDLLSSENPVLAGFAFYCMVLVLKMMLIYLLTVRQRFKKKIFISPEDSFFAPTGTVKYDDEDIERIRRAHRNDMENIYLFMLTGFFFVLSDPNYDVAMNLFRVFAAARIVHTLVYAVVVVPQPARALAFVVGLLVNAAMVVITLIKFHHF